MTLVYTSPTAFLYQGDCIEVMRQWPDNSVDAVVCDPPYALSFMGKSWDHFEVPAGVGADRDFKAGATGRAHSHGIASHKPMPFQEWCRAWGAEALRVLKPGGHLIAFGGSRTYHRLTCALEDAGFEIRDSLMWIYLNGFPKSLNAGQGRGTALKPAHEPCVLARKPLAGTVAANVAKWGTGVLNIDANKLGSADDVPAVKAVRQTDYPQTYNGNGPGWGRTRGGRAGDEVNWSPTGGRWPANVIMGEDVEPQFARYFYCPKVSRKERDTGCESLPERTAVETVERDPESAGAKNPRAGAGRGAGATTKVCAKCERNVDGGRALELCDDGNAHEIVAGAARPAVKNHHPTVKPVALMRWLVRLVTPPGGLVLDPFVGSGSTGIAAQLEGCRFVGIEREAEYLQVAAVRINSWQQFNP